MHYNQYSTEDFVTDPLFIKWVKESDEKVDSFWKTWLGQNPEKLEIIEDARRIILFLQFEVQKPTTQEFDEVKANIKNQIFKEEEEVIQPFSYQISYGEHSQKTKRSYSFNSFVKIAASFLILGFLTALFFILIPLQNDSSYATSKEELRTIILPDNSKVTLNANSNIKFASSWDGNATREVWLTGEAFFEVVKKQVKGSKNQRIKFIVHTPNLDVEVLGTRFNVKNTDQGTNVVLNSGKIKLRVELNNQETSILMKPGELVEFRKKENTISKATVKPEVYSSWQNQELVFEDQSLSEIAEVLQKQLGLEVIVEDSALAKMRFTGTTPRNDLDILFTSIAHSFNTEVIKEKNRVIIKKKE